MLDLIIKLMFIAGMCLSGAYAVSEFTSQANKFNDSIREAIK